MTLNRILKKIIGGVFTVLRIQTDERRIESVSQFFKFCIVGITNTAISYFLNITVLLLLKPYGLSWDYVAGNLVAFILSVLWSFYWNNKYVFSVKEGEKRNLWQALLKTYLSYAVTGIVLANILSYLWISVVGISKLIAPILNLIISVPTNYLINKKWAFKT